MIQNPRNFTPEELARIKSALAERAPFFTKCPLCGTDNWGVGPGYVSLAIQPQRTSGSMMLIGGPSFPTLAFVCRQCGNTILLNIHILGLADMFGLVPPSVPTSEDKPAESAPPEAIGKAEAQ